MILCPMPLYIPNLKHRIVVIQSIPFSQFTYLYIYIYIYMAIDMEKAGVTELYVRMDCNGCAHRIKKAIRTIDGVQDINIDIQQQKIRVVGGADPELLVKAINKRKKTATICSHTEPAGTNTEPAASQPPSESPPAEATPPPTEPPKDVPPTEPPKDPPAPPPLAETPEVAKPPHQEPNVDVREVNMMHHYHPRNFVYGGHWNNFGHDTRNLTPYNVMHSYNTHRPSPYVAEYVSDYGPISTTPRDHTRYDGYGDGYYYYQNRGGDSNQMGSLFSEENPNSCTIA